MKRQLLISVNKMDYMINVDINCSADTTVFHVTTHPAMHEYMPESFDLIQEKDSEELASGPEINALSSAARAVVEQIKAQLEALPAQFKGKKQV